MVFLKIHPWKINFFPVNICTCGVCVVRNVACLSSLIMVDNILDFMRHALNKYKTDQTYNAPIFVMTFFRFQ
jgi:hypothetical protein